MRRKVILILSGLLFGLVVVEVALRVAGLSHPRTWMLDPVRGPVRRPGQTWEQKDEGHGFVRINRFGFRDREWDTAPKRDAIRIAVIGDSYIEALQVEETDRMTSVLERELRKGAPSGTEVEVMNFGVTAAGTAQELLTYRQVVRRFHPDWVVLAFMTGNDVSDNHRRLSGDYLRPFFRVDNGKLTTGGLTRVAKDRIRRGLTRLAFSLQDGSRVFQAASRARTAWLERSFQKNMRQTRTTRGEAAALEFNSSTDSYRAPVSPEWLQAWNVTDALVRRFAEDVRADGSRFLLVSIASSIEAHPDTTVRGAFCRDIGVPDLSYTRTRIAGLAREEDIPFLDLAAAMAESARVTGTFYHGFPNTSPGLGHWNESGHALAGRILARWFLAHGKDPLSPGVPVSEESTGRSHVE
jgi:hypothetical protein